MEKLKTKVEALWAKLPDPVKRVFHTFWQAAAGALVAGVLTVHSTADAQLLVATAVAVGLAAVKAYVLHLFDTKA